MKRYGILLGRVAIDWGGGGQIPGQDAVTLHLADPVGAGAEAGHVETPGALSESILAGDTQGQQVLVAGVGGVRKDCCALAGLWVAAEAPAAGGFGQRCQQDERLLGTGKVEDNLTAGEQTRVVEPGLPEGDAAFVGQVAWQEPGGFRVTSGAALLNHVGSSPGG